MLNKHYKAYKKEKREKESRRKKFKYDIYNYTSTVNHHYNFFL